jgi:hypothetical protein
VKITCRNAILLAQQPPLAYRQGVPAQPVAGPTPLTSPADRRERGRLAVTPDVIVRDGSVHATAASVLIQANQPITHFSHNYNQSEIRGPRAHLFSRTRG